MLINSGTTGNFIKKSIAQKLGIVTSPNKAIKIVHMANKGTEVIDSTAYNMPYKIGDYQAKGNFDLIPLAYHDVILGIPWLRKVNPQINWAKDLVTVTEGDKQITLPSKRSSKVEMVSAMQIRRIAKKEEVYLYVIKNSDVDKQLEELDPRVGPLLLEYKDVFPEELPHSLSLQRNVDHKIDVIPGSEPFKRGIYSLS